MKFGDTVQQCSHGRTGRWIFELLPRRDGRPGRWFAPCESCYKLTASGRGRHVRLGPVLRVGVDFRP